LGSSIIGLEEHTQENLSEVIEYAVSHDTDFHQFMLYTANPGTPLYEQLKTAGRLLPANEFAHADSHGQYRFNHRHLYISDHQEEQLLISAFERDFELNGPSLYRMIRTIMTGWRRYKDHADMRIRKRYAREVKPLQATYAGGVWAMVRWYSQDGRMSQKMVKLLKNLYETFGVKTRIVAPLVGRYIYAAMKKEEKRLANGWTLEPATFYQGQTAVATSESDATTSSQTAAAPISLKPTVSFEPAMAESRQ
jgi:hypothetical protein